MDDNYLRDKIDRIAEDSAATRTDIKNLYQFVAAVRDNQKETRIVVDKHILEIDAHGVSGGRRATDSFMRWITLALATVGLFLGFKKDN